MDLHDAQQAAEAGADGIAAPVLSRRQFGLLIGGGAVLLAAGGAFGIYARTRTGAAAAAATSFGSLQLLRAGRLARLGTDGRPAFASGESALALLTKGPAAGPAGGAGVREPSVHDHAGGVSGHSIPGTRWPPPENHTWGDVVIVELQVHNAGAGPMLFSPGQLRLRAGRAPATITPQDAGRSPGAIGPGETVLTWVSYLAPQEATEFELDFTDPFDDAAIALPLPAFAAIREHA
ncbi:DUF4352 domain-containing protein [Arthrobacter sp. I2-34]|uniref:DUF4352 domain-containing protein n=1 Tax=Arthrobacter hankyongi TaxID=2904801 RepID=A0ABS9L8U1_9MICC|nr:DUF4352 domain-containing protein [Arthrobacter hankyongi]MCG2622904.1 DUF4352 domain-containing protein [Arthrobacter hankyongi]